MRQAFLFEISNKPIEEIEEEYSKAILIIIKRIEIQGG